MSDQADDVEMVSYDPGLREVLSGQGAVGGRKIHADDLDPVLVYQLVEIILQRLFTAAGDHVEDPVLGQIAESGGIAAATGEEMLVDAQYARTPCAAAFRVQTSKPVQEPALDGSAGKVLPASPNGCG